MSESGSTEERFEVKYFDGINATVQSTLAKRTELSHSENARSPLIGVLEKREGQVVKGVTSTDTEFIATDNQGIFYFNNTQTDNTGVFRVSTVSGSTDIYYHHTNDRWLKMSDALAQGLTAADIDTTVADQKIIIVNGTDTNRSIDTDGVTMNDSTAAGDLYNSPPAKKVVYYKNRIHLADFTRSGTRYPTTIIRSSYPLGVIALVDGDHDAGVTKLQITEAKYFYAAAGVNSYDVYRGGTLIETITVTSVEETHININATSNALLSSDEIYIGGTFTGAKQFRWVNNPTSSGADVKQYDTLKLTGGDDSPITLFTTIGNVLMIGNKNNLATWDDYNMVNLDLGIGAVSDRGHVKLLGTLYFIDYSGIYGTTGDMPTLLSRKVERYIKGATQSGLENSVAGVKGLSVFFTIGDVTLYNPDGSQEKVVPKVALEYSVGDQNWYVHTNVDYSDFVHFNNAAGQEQLWGTSNTTNAPVASFLEGNLDFEKEIFMRIDTQQFQLMKEFEVYAKPLNIITEIDRGSQVQCYISLDSKQYYELSGNAGKGATKLKVQQEKKGGEEPPITKKIKLSYRDGSKQRCRINQLAISYLPTTLEKQYE